MWTHRILAEFRKLVYFLVGPLPTTPPPHPHLSDVVALISCSHIRTAGSGGGWTDAGGYTYSLTCDTAFSLHCSNSNILAL